MKHEKLCFSCWRVPAVLPYSECADARTPLHGPHLQDPPAGGVDDEKQSVTSGEGGRGGELPIPAFFLDLQPTQLGVSITWR